ncbi:MAG: rhomboid family intramembrane serine protease [Pseudomonadota bacterium]
MLFPLRDENPLAHPPIATICLIALNGLAWVFLQGMGSPAALGESLCVYGLIPGDLLGTAPPGSGFPIDQERVCIVNGEGGIQTLLTSMFMHGGWFHLLGNMWFLWIFGDNVEDAMGPARFAVFYLLCGLAAAAAQTATDPDSAIPMVGASGAIGGVMGGYALLYPRARILSLFVIVTVSVPAFLMLGYWVLIQFVGSFTTDASGGGVAFWAHIGGFVAGLALVLPFRRERLYQEHVALPDREDARYRWF